MTQHEFCYVCGSKVEQKGDNVWWCYSCGQDFYDNPRACAEAVLFNSAGEVLLCERAFEPNMGKYDLPGGFMDASESVEQALQRELAEEPGLTKTDISKPAYLTSWPYDYPWGKETYNVITITFTARLLTNKKIIPEDDVASIRFMKSADITTGMLSVPIIKDVIDLAVAAAK